MKKLFYTLIFIAGVLLFTNGKAKAGPDFDPKITLKSNSDYGKVIKERDYNKAVRRHKQITNSLLGVQLDFQLGYGSTSPNVDQNANSKTISTESQGGFTFGSLININLLGLFDLTTGLDFINKKYSYGIPYADSVQSIDSITNSVKNTYMNIPLNVTYSGMISEDFGMSFSGGPYFGFLLNPDNAVNGFKDFDFGLNGILTGRYYLNQFVSVLLGGNVQYGGLNNLLSANSVSSLKLVNWGAFTGLGIGF
ncbi:MAG TPA: outer membrane beta-barrel protein [Ignavibacteria bacterium]|nr:outer membrane beta-barrel protein [Ignavibacteria bacterium]HMR40447.1 outer membrane beta-barrel protein [Ignavibacteria bacterium]